MNTTRIKLAMMALLITLVGTGYVLATCYRDTTDNCVNDCNCGPSERTFLTGTGLVYTTNGQTGQSGRVASSVRLTDCACIYQWDNNGTIETDVCTTPYNSQRQDDNSAECFF